jgi:predicted glycosyltransferase involved in capsule biosynthesis
MKTVILTPFRATPGREQVWDFVRAWIDDHYPMPVFVGDNEGVFSPSAARNQAARASGEWDVAVFHDSDTIAHPDAVAQAVKMASTGMQMVVTADSHMYCDETSTQRIMGSGSPAFARPDSFDEHGIYEKPCSGVFAVNRKLWNTVGGYVQSLEGWGYEDLVFLQMCGIFAGGNTWVPGHINLHLWHPPAPRTDDTVTNKRVWQTLTQYRLRRDRKGARHYLASLGHTVP